MPTGRTGTVTSLAPWFGGKRTLAPRIVEVLGPHRCYWEPFCGSMAVLLAKDACNQETVNDLHGDLVNLARVIRDEDLCQKLYWRLRRTLAAEELFRESLGVVRAGAAPGPDDGPSAERAYHYFVSSWLGLNGVAGTSKFSTNFARRYSSNGGDAPTRFVSAVEALPGWHDRLRSVAIYRGDGIEMCGRIEDKAGTVVYADPPYLVKGAEYEHDFAPADHDRLAAALTRFRLTRVVVSYSEHPDLARLYPGWGKVPLAATKGVVNAGRRAAGRVAAPEVLLVNQPVGAGLFPAGAAG
jgi:DNA adenine methylase